MKQDRDTEQSPEAGLDALREHYRRIGAAGPPAAIDAAVLGQARAALRRRPRVAGWWVPTTLAATVVIAFSLLLRVQQEPVAPVPAEQALVAPQHEAMPQAPARDFAPDALREEDAAPAPAGSAAVTAERTPPVVSDATSAAAPAAAPPAEPVLMATEAAAPAAVTARAAARAAAPVAASAPREKALADEASLPTAEEWLARIEELEAAGRREEARAERERLEAAYPGWLAARSRKRD